MSVCIAVAGLRRRPKSSPEFGRLLQCQDGDLSVLWRVGGQVKTDAGAEGFAYRPVKCWRRQANAQVGGRAARYAAGLEFDGDFSRAVHERGFDGGVASKSRRDSDGVQRAPDIQPVLA